MATVGIGPQFFKKSLNDYRDWRWALPREAMQNSMDAPRSRNINILIETVDGNTLFTWSNDGDPMSKEELEGKLLTLGESGKDFKGTVGGFGKAKEILLFSHLSYEILTGDYRVVGSGGNYDIENWPYFAGTQTKVLIEGDISHTLITNLKTFLFMSQWRGVTINGETYNETLHKGSRRREFDWGIIYTNKSIADRMVVRINGIPMFYRHLDCNRRCVVVELKSGNASVLQSNRDSLKYEYQSQLDAFIDEITVNKVSAFRDTQPRYTHYNGKKLFNLAATRANDTIQSIIAEAYATIPTKMDVDDFVQMVIEDKAAVYAPAKQATYEQGSQSKISHEFVIKNNTGMGIPAHYLPSDFSEYSEKLTKIWTKSMLALHDLFGKKVEFSVGFIFDEDRAAEFESGVGYGNVYYINPITIIKQDSSNSRSMAKRWKFTPAGRWSILAKAVHEYVHGAMGLSGHDELYSSTLTELMGVVLKERQRFNKCFV
jgi:hypothetical protein